MTTISTLAQLSELKQRNSWLHSLLTEITPKITQAIMERKLANQASILVKITPETCTAIGVDLRRYVARLSMTDYKILEQAIRLLYPKFIVHMKMVHLLIQQSLSKILNPHIVRIRIWCSGYTHRHSRTFTPSNIFLALLYYGICCESLRTYDGTVGHVSLEAYELYVSWWPQNDAPGAQIKAQLAAQKSTPELDELAEGRPPDYVIDLSELKIKNIRIEYDTCLLNLDQYHIIGRNSLCRLNNANSCCGMVYDLLLASEIPQSRSRTCNCRDDIITTPNNMIDFIMYAKELERRNQ